MKKKVFRVIIGMVSIVILIIFALLAAQMFMMQTRLVENGKKAGEVMEGLSENAMHSQTHKFLLESSQIRARLYDETFEAFQDSVVMIADAAADIYDNPEYYGPASQDQYDESNLGELVSFVAYGDEVDSKGADVQKEEALLGNLRSTLKSVNRSNEFMTAAYFATESGLFFCAEKVTEYNLPKENEPLYFEARRRPWYQEAKAKGVPTFTGMIHDADTGKDALSCGVPVYSGGVLKGVAGAGLFLDTIRSDVDSFRVGNKGFACVINDRGQILFSGTDKSELAASKNEGQDLRNSENDELVYLAKAAMRGDTGVTLVTLTGGDRYYVAYAPMETVSWSYMTVLPVQEVQAPTEALVRELYLNTQNQNAFVKKSITSSFLFLLLIFLLMGLAAFLISEQFSRGLVQPVAELTEKVKNTEGDNLDFTWELQTGDEVQVLAEAFGSMTKRMKQYIADITAITAEKERIGAELSVATHIQASMLPGIFPAYPDRKEFDLYAAMDPAKEVGGDFYDFFFIDGDHLALVIADVSGKGVPAALFMVIAMTIIENTAHSTRQTDLAFELTNNQLCEGNAESMFVTAWIGIVNLKTGIMSWCDAGHENPYIIHADGSIELIRPKKKRPPIAAVEDVRYIANETQLQKGDRLFLYTDGVVEATSADVELFGNKRLEESLHKYGSDAPDTLLKNVRRDIDAFVGDAPQFDDLTMLAFQYFG